MSIAVGHPTAPIPDMKAAAMAESTTRRSTNGSESTDGSRSRSMSSTGLMSTGLADAMPPAAIRGSGLRFGAAIRPGLLGPAPAMAAGPGSSSSAFEDP